jgi:hypothetical protein
MAHVSKASIINRQDCCQDRIRCYQLQLLTSLNQTLMVFNFTTIASSYDLRDVATPEGQASCVAKPSPPPPTPPMPPVPALPVCPGDAELHVRYMRMVYVGGPSCSFMNLAELQLWYNGYNVAQGKPATSLDVYGRLPQYVSGKITDGQSNTFYSSGSFNSSTYVLVDLLVRP